MKATFALVANRDAYNVVRKLAWDIHQRYRTGTAHCRLPPHISLKQPFRVPETAAAEDYMRDLARSIQPFEVTLTEVRVVPLIHDGVDYGILWLDVEKTAQLSELHERVNHELSQRFGNTEALHDGPDYEFHMTVVMGGQPVDTYRRFLSELPNRRIDLRYAVRELAMFVYDEPTGPTGDYLCYKILPLGV